MTQSTLLCLALAMLSTSASADSVIFRDLTHNSLGEATLDLVDPDTLVVGNVGSSGLDGVSIDLPTACYYRARWAALAPHQDGDLLRMKAFDDLNELRGTLGFEDAGPDLQFAVDLPPGGFPLNQVRIYNNFSVVYDGVIADVGVAATVERWPDEVHLESMCSDAISSSMAFLWDSPILVTIPGHGTVGANSIQVISGAFSSQFEEFRIEAAGFPSITLLESEYGLRGGAVNDAVPARATLGPNVPNPFNAHTEIHYSVSEPGSVSLVIYDASGRRVKQLIDSRVEPGDYDIPWDGRDDAGRRVASGVYLYQLNAGQHSETKRMVMVK